MAKSVSVSWIGDMTFDAVMGGHHVILDVPAPAGHDRGPSPTLLLLAGVAGCTAIDVVSILKKARQPLEHLTVRAEGVRVEGHPRRFERITVTYEVTGPGLDPKAVQRAVDLSEEKYCSVAATVREHTDIVTVVQINP